MSSDACTLLAASYPRLRVDANGDGSYAEPPSAVATFGIFRNEQRRIYQREVIGH